MSLAIGTLLQSIYLDVLLVISAPLARSAARRIGPLGTPRMAAAMAIGLECGIVLMVPGVGTLALAALLHVPLGAMLLWGLVLIIPTILISVSIMTFLFRRGFWNSATDEVATATEEAKAEVLTAVSAARTARTAGTAHQAPARPDVAPASGPDVPKGNDGDDFDDTTGGEASGPGLLACFAPLLVALLMIAVGAVADAVGRENAVLKFIADPVFAMLIGLIGTLIVGRVVVGRKRVETAISNGFRESGQILALTAVGGSLAAVVATGGLGDILRGYFTAHTFLPLLLVWLVAAALRALRGAGAEVIVATRNPTGDQRALDLSDLGSVRAFVAGWTGPVHAIVANAGIMALPTRQVAANGWELQLATNFLGHFALITGLHENLRQAGDARVVMVSSGAQLRAPLDFDDPHFEHRPYDPWAAYAQSKTADVLLAVGLARRWAAGGVTANAFEPGYIHTNLQWHLDDATMRAMDAMDEEGNLLTPDYYKTPEQGAATSVLLAASPLLDGVTGRYFSDNQEAEVVPGGPGTASTGAAGLTGKISWWGNHLTEPAVQVEG